MKIVGIIPFYKPKSEELDNVLKYIGDLDYCLLIDDSGFDNRRIMAPILNKYPDTAKYIVNKDNIGLCATVNKGFELANEISADWVLVMNPDGTFENNSIEIYREFIKKNDTSNIALIAPVYNIDRRPRRSGEGYKEIKYPDMSGSLYNMSVLNKIGYYDLNTYFYGLDTEFCIRARKKGYSIIECSEAVLNHNPAETYEVKVFGKTIFKCGKDTPKRYYYQFRSAVYINKKYHDFYNFAFHVYKFMKVVFLFDNKKTYFKMIKKGICDARNGYYGK